MRLTNEMRSMLGRYVDKEVVDEKTLKPLNEEKQKLLEKFEYITRKKYDQKDMLVLKKYGKATKIGKYYASYRTDSYSSIEIRVKASPDTLAPCNYEAREQDISIERDIEASLIEKCARLQISHTDANNVIRDPYRKLISSCNTVNQLAEAWPEVKNAFPQWFEPKKSTALIALSKEDLAWIRADSARRVAKKLKDQ